MAASQPRWSVRKFVRTLLFALPAALFLIGLWGGAGQISNAARWRLRLLFVSTVEVVYLTTIAVSAFAIPVLVRRLLRSRRRGIARPVTARFALLSSSLIFAFGMCEALVSLWTGGHSLAPIAVPDQDGVDVSSFRPQTYHTVHTPLPDRFPLKKGPNEVEIVVIGESSAAGVPFSRWFHTGELVRRGLAEAFPSKHFYVTSVAVSGHSLESQRNSLPYRLTRQPDIVVIYAGHNEIHGRFPWNKDQPDYYIDGSVPRYGEEILASIERTSPVCGLLHREAERCRIAIPPPPDGQRDLVDTPVYAPAESATILREFREHLEEMIAYAKAQGAIPLLVIPAGNDAGFEPNRSFLPRETTSLDRSRFARDFLAARRTEEQDSQTSITLYEQLIVRGPRFAEAHFRLARVLEAAGRYEEAYGHYVQARDDDGLPMRIPSEFQEVYRELATKYDCVLVDVQSYFHAIGEHGILDDNLFQDVQHPSLKGYSAIAQAILAALKARRAFDWPDSVSAPSVDATEIAKAYHLDNRAWIDIIEWETEFGSTSVPIRYDKSIRKARQETYSRLLPRLKAGERPESLGIPNIGVPPRSVMSE